MATKEDILGILAGESGPMNRTVLGKRLSLPTSSFQNQLDRMEKQGLVGKNEQNEYTITEAGRQFALAQPPPPPDETPPGEPTDESLKTTEYQQFVEMGKTTGVVPLALIEQTTNHIWRGGDFRDLTWVWKGLTEMGIRPDLAQRWFHSWRSYLHQAIPPELATSVGAPQPSAEKGAAKEAVGKGKRDYILGPNDTPLYVGEGVGDLDYEDAVKLSTVRAAALARFGAQAGQPGQPVTPGTMADEVLKIFNAFKETMGPQTKGKSYIVKPGQEGYIIEEVEEGKPTLITTPQGDKNPSPSFLIDSEGNVTEAPAGRPIVVKQAAPAPPQSGKAFIVKQTSEGTIVEEHDLSKPLIINAGAPGAGLPAMYPFPAMGADGKPIVGQDGKPVYVDIEPMMKWMGFQSEQRRSDERHGAIMSLASTIKENLPIAVEAFNRAVSEVKGKAPESAAQQYECGECHTKFTLPRQPGEDEMVECPNCHHQWPSKEVIAT